MYVCFIFHDMHRDFKHTYLIKSLLKRDLRPTLRACMFQFPWQGEGFSNIHTWSIAPTRCQVTKYACLKHPYLQKSLLSETYIHTWNIHTRSAHNIHTRSTRCQVTKYVCLRHPYILAQESQAYIHAYILAWGCLTYIDTHYSLVALI